MKILSIQVGKPKEIQFRGQTLTTAIFKSPVKDPVFVGKTNIAGDQQADLRVHGGPDKAVYGFSFAAYGWWNKNRPDVKLNAGAFGENLTFDDIDEDKVYIGDSFQVGQAVLQVAQPRLPCGKLAAKFNDLTVIKSFTQSRRPGVYFRVLEVGLIQPGDSLKLVSQEKIAVSVNELADLITKGSMSAARAAEILQLKGLPDFWIKQIQQLID